MNQKSPPWVYVLTFLVVPSVTLLTTVISHFTIHKYEFSLVIPMIVMGLIWPLFSGFGEDWLEGLYLTAIACQIQPFKSGAPAWGHLGMLAPSNALHWMEGLWRLYDSGVSGDRIHQSHLTDINYDSNIR
jgi:hypothetical protein